MKQKNKFILGVVIQFVLLFSIILYALFYLTNGQTVYLKVSTSPENSKIVSGGSYLKLDYDIATLKLKDLYVDFDYENINYTFGNKFYLTLEEREDLGYWVPSALTLTVPEYTVGKVYVESTFLLSTFDENGDIVYKMNYNFKDYFIPANKKVEIKIKEIKNEDLKVKLLIKDKGNVKLLKFLVNNEEII